ncbi:hypothetical protein JZ751_010896, partial [Albula glossodonta]
LGKRSTEIGGKRKQVVKKDEKEQLIGKKSNQTRNDSWGTWSAKGCKTVLTDASHTKCLCDRVSTFAILAQQPREITMEYSGVPTVTLIVGCGLSCLALITLAVVYAVLWRYIRSERSIILINFCLSIVCSNVLILVGQTQTQNA